MIIPYTIVSCADSKIIDVFEHENTAQNDWNNIRFNGRACINPYSFRP
jgi:hypothetical protein